MNNDIYDQGIEEKREANILRKETGNNRKYFLEGTDTERKQRLEQSTQNRNGVDNFMHNENKKFNKCTQKKNPHKNGKKIIKKFIPTVGMIGLIIAGTSATIGKIEEYKEQKRIDDSISDNYNEYIQKISETEQNLSFTNEDLMKTKEFYKAIDTYNKTKSLTEKSKARATIIEFMECGHFKHTATTTIEKKMEEAILYGNYDKYDNNEDFVKVVYVDGVRGDSDRLKIKGLDSKYYSMNSFDVWSEDIPDNLKELAKDIFELQDKHNWKTENECVKTAIEMSEDLGKVVQEHYIINESADIERISNEKYEEIKGKDTSNIVKKEYKTTSINNKIQDEIER